MIVQYLEARSAKLAAELERRFAWEDEGIGRGWPRPMVGVPWWRWRPGLRKAMADEWAKESERSMTKAFLAAGDGTSKADGWREIASYETWVSRGIYKGWIDVYG